MDLGLSGKVAIVTGGSKGIGYAIADELAHEGVDIALVARNQDALTLAATQLAEKSKRTIRIYPTDTGVDTQVKATVAAIARDFGRIDILVNSAAMPAGQGPVKKLAAIDDEAFWSDVNVKVMGYLRFAREAAPYLKLQGDGRIINIAGLAARQTGSIVGSIRNVAVAALTKNLADELGPDGINVTCVHPGLTRTEKTAAVVAARAEAAGVDPAQIEEQMADGTSIRKLVTAEEVAWVVTFLASPRSVAISGDAISAGGGRPGAIYY